MKKDPQALLEQVVRDDGRYPLDAYGFLHTGLEYSAQRIYGPRRADDERRHVTGQQVCEGLRDLSRELWGPLAGDVLRQWGITRTRDFGEMVFLLVEHGLMGKQDSDAIEDFADVYDFADAFGQYRVDLEREARQSEADV